MRITSLDYIGDNIIQFFLIQIYHSSMIYVEVGGIEIKILENNQTAMISLDRF